MLVNVSKDKEEYHIMAQRVRLDGLMITCLTKN